MNILTYQIVENMKTESLCYFEMRGLCILLQLFHKMKSLLSGFLLYLFIPKRQRLPRANGLAGAPNLK